MLLCGIDFQADARQVFAESSMMSGLSAVFAAGC